MKNKNYLHFSLIIFSFLLLINCSVPKKRINQQIYILPKGCHGYCALFCGDNYNPINDTSDTRVFNFDSTGIVFTKLTFIGREDNKIYLRNNGHGYDTLRFRGLERPSENSIYTSIVRSVSIAGINAASIGGKKDVIIDVFYVGVPPDDPSKEEFFFNRKLEEIAKKYCLLRD